MKANVILKMEVRVTVEGNSMEEIEDWAIQHTPQEAVDLADKHNSWADVYYEEEVYEASPSSKTDIDIR